MKIGRTTILKWLCLLLLAGYATWATIWAHDEASRHICREYEVMVDASYPMDSIIRHGVLEELKRYPGRIKGLPINQIDTRRIGRFLNNLNTFESVSCMVTASGTLCIQVTPMIPVMRVFVGNKSYYINKDGKHIASNAEFFSDVPVVSGKFTHSFQPRDVLPLVRFVESDAVMRDLTSMIEAQDSHNLIIVPRITGHVVNFGDTTRLEQKRDALQLFYRKVMPYKGWEQYDTISVKYRNQIVATRRDKTRLNIAEEDTEEVDLEEGTLPQVDHQPLQAEPTPAGNAQKKETATQNGEQQTKDPKKKADTSHE